MRIHYLICFLLLIYFIFILNNEKYNLTYNLDKIETENQNGFFQYAGCLNLDVIFKNESMIYLNQLDNNLNVFFRNVNYKYPFNLISKTIEKFNLNLIKLKKYFIFKSKICLQANKSTELEYFHSIQFDFKFYLFDKKSLEFFRLEDYTIKVIELIVLNKEKPFSNCVSKSINKFKCLNDCIKNDKKQRLSKYYYSSEEKGIFYLKYDKYNKTVVKNEEECNEICDKEESCRLNYFLPNYGFKKESKVKIIKGYPLISEFDYLTQIIGLVCLMFNISFNQLFYKLIKVFEKLKFRKYMIFIKFFILLFCLVCMTTLYVQMTIEYIHKRDYPVKKEIQTTLLQHESISLMGCLSLNNFFNFSNNELNNKNLLEIEKISSNQFSDEFLTDIYLEYKRKKIKINWHLDKSDVIFYDKKRCFLFKINHNLKEAKYQSLLSNSKLVIDHMNFEYAKFFFFYLLTKNEVFNTKVNYLSRSNEVMKIEIRRSKSNRNLKCIDYENFDQNNLNCFCMQNCVDRCVNRQLIKQNQNASTHSVLFKSQFNKIEWSKLYLNDSHHLYNNIKSICLKKHIELPCYESHFKEIFTTSNTVNKKLTKFESYYEIKKEIEEEPSIYKLIMDMLNIQSILFGLNLFKLNLIVFLYFKFNFKYYKILIYFICLIGFSYHFWFIFHEIIHGEMIFSQHYKLSKSIKMSDLIFCVKIHDFNLKDLNNALNYDYLDGLTRNLNLEILKKIEILNKSHEWNTLDLKKLNFSDQRNNIDQFSFSYFFYLDFKCFLFKQEINYEENPFEYKEVKKVFKIKFNEKLIEKNRMKIYFISKISNSMQISKTIELNPYEETFKISQELFEIEYNDKFNIMKNPMSIFYGENNLNDPNQYLTNFIEKFRKNYHLNTLNLPLERDNSNNNLEIDDDLLFDQYFKQIQNVTDHQIPPNLNYKRTFIINHLQKKIMWNDFENSKEPKNAKEKKSSTFSLIFFRKVLVVTNEDNYAKLILNLLNLVSIWFGLGFLNLCTFLFKIKILFNSLFRLLFRARLILRRKIN